MHRFLFAAILSFAVCSHSAEFPEPRNSETDLSRPLMPASEAAAKMQVPRGFRVQVFASEPEVQNPIAMAWDPRGRMWVAENYTYAEHRVRFDLTHRDRVLIFEDKDNDGRADSRKLFTDTVQMLTSVEVGRGGVWLMCPPQLLFIPDANGDDMPDGPPQVKLDGFTVAKDNYHNFANGLRWGPDGWLYGRCGHSCPGSLGAPGTPDDLRIPLDGGIWRYHPERKVVEVLCHGTTNPWGHDWDANGELFFINTVNGHLWHLMPGAHLKESFGQSQNPHVYERLDTIADHYHYDTAKGWGNSRDGKANDLGGGHSHIGMMVYHGDTWPVEYRGKLFTLNQHGRRANVERLERKGCGYVGRHEPDVFLAADPWFRGLEISTGPDGNAYLIDWSDTGECHENTGVHRTSGRIYKVSYGEPRKPGPCITPRCMIGDGKLQQLWRDYQAGNTTEEKLEELLIDPDESVRVWAIRLLTDAWPLDTLLGPRKDAVYPNSPVPIPSRFYRVAMQDSSGLVLLTLASVLQRLPVGERASLASMMLVRQEFVGDPHLPALIWYGLIPEVAGNPKRCLSLMSRWRQPLTVRWASRYFASRSDREPDLLDRLAAIAGEMDPHLQDSVLFGMSEAFKGWRKAPKPDAWDALVAGGAAKRHPELIRELSTLFGDGRALDEIKAIALDGKADMTMRITALRSYIEARPPDLRTVCDSLLNVRVLSATAVRGLALFDDPALGVRLAKDYRNFHPVDRPAVMETLVSRVSFAAALLERMASGQIPRADLSAFHARQIRAFNDAALSKQLAEVWGELRDTPADKAAAIAAWKAILTPAVLAKADLSNGRALYAVCAACHTLYGEGGKAGPDLTGSGRANIDYLLENILDPSAVVPADMRMSILSLKDGRTLGGIIAAQNERTLTLRTLTEEVTVEKSSITKQELSAASLMPDGLLQALNEDQVRDLVAYLMHPVQVPLK
jgi:putative membrane-bound dehydrogenase-like protein